MINLEQLNKQIKTLIWATPSLSAYPRWQASLIWLARLFYVIGRDLADGQLTLRAMSLVYTTLLSLVPLLAVSFSVLKAFGVHNQIEPLLLNLLAPLGEKSGEITENIIRFVENMKVGVLGAVGLALLFYTVIALMQKIERAFNYTWRVSQNRPLAQRFSGYLSVIIIGPVLVFSSLALTASVMTTDVYKAIAAIEPFGSLLQLLTSLAPYFMIIGAFTFIYVFIPNTRVKLSSAFVGALVAGVLWQTTGWGFATFIATSGKYTAVYSAFATLILFMIWLYLGWLILLLGASISFYHQQPENLRMRRRDPRLSNRVRERLALLAMEQIARNLYAGEKPCTAQQLARALNTPHGILVTVMEALEQQGLLKKSDDRNPVYLPTRPLDRLTVLEVWQAIRSAYEEHGMEPPPLPPHSRLAELDQELDEALAQVLGRRTLSELVASAKPKDAEPDTLS